MCLGFFKVVKMMLGLNIKIFKSKDWKIFKDIFGVSFIMGGVLNLNLLGGYFGGVFG